MQQMDEKLKSLQLNGLIEFNDKAAKYAPRTFLMLQRGSCMSNRKVRHWVLE